MAEINVTTNYISKYSGDQLDAAIAALGSLSNLFITQTQFKNFIYGTNDENGEHIEGFNEKMDTLNKNVSQLAEFLNLNTIGYTPYDETKTELQSNNKQ